MTKTRCLNVRLSTEEYTKLRSAAELLDVSMTGLVKSMVDIYVADLLRIERLDLKRCV